MCSLTRRTPPVVSKSSTGVAARALYHPPPLADRLRPGGYGAYVLVVGRLEAVKRPELAIRALAHVPSPMGLVIVGEGSQRGMAEKAATDSASAIGWCSPEQSAAMSWSRSTPVLGRLCTSPLMKTTGTSRSRRF